MWPIDYDRDPADAGTRKSMHPFPPLIDGDQVVGEVRSFADQDALTRTCTDRAIDFVRRHRHEPFFLYVPYSMPHVPLGVSPEFRGRTSTAYGDVMEEIDDSVGRILETLAELGLDNDTMIVFTSDNGPWLNFGDHAGSAGSLREGKGTTWEGGARVPCIVRFPDRIPAGSECDAIASTIDMLPTIAALTGAPLPVRRIDGVDLWPMLRGDRGTPPRDHLYFYYGNQLQAVRQGRWKLHFPHSYRKYEGETPGTGGVPGPTSRGRTGLELYDLATDSGERRDVAFENPEIVAGLITLAERARLDLGDEGLPGTGRRRPGRIESGD